MTPYEILGVSPDCQQNEITKAYRKLAQKYHPDKQGGDPDKFNAVADAYNKVGTVEARKQFDSGVQPLSIEAVRNTIAQSIKAALEENVQTPCLTRIRQFLYSEIAKRNMQIARVKKSLLALEANSKRVTTRDDVPNMFEVAVASLIEERKAMITAENEAVAQLTAMQKELEFYEEGPVVFPKDTAPAKNEPMIGYVVPGSWSEVRG